MFVCECGLVLRVQIKAEILVFLKQGLKPLDARKYVVGYMLSKKKRS